MSDVILRDVYKSFGTVDVIKGVDLDIKSGEFVVFVGPSGCGKTTLLRMIAGLESVTSGTLEIGGTLMNDVDPSKRGVAMVFQSYALYPHMSVRDNMGFALRFAKVPKAEIARQVAEAAKILGLEELLDRKPKQLSGGQRQRVAIGRAIVRHPSVFLFDEPLSNLDAELRVHMRIEVARLHRQLKTTIVYVTHDQVEAMTLADRIVVLREGRVEQAGAPLDLYDSPENTFVAGFIGSPKMNFFRCAVEGGSDQGTMVRLSGRDDAVIPVAGASAAIAPGTPVLVGIRPEHFKSEGPASLELSVDMVEHLGGETFAYAYGGADEAVIVKTDGGREWRTGQTIKAFFDPSRALLFREDGTRIH